MPLLSVIVPAYDVEEWLEPSLRSILGQSHRDLEVLVVDDGSTDQTGAIADRIASADDRLRVIHQANGGLGAARNVGVEQATGELLAFADSDDLVLPGAYERLVGSLAATGSDLAAGSVERLRGNGQTFVTPLMRENHRTDRLAVRVEDAPLMLADVFAWNKVYRREFWLAHRLQFPTGVSYEDQPTLTRALVHARFDVLSAPVYQWRVRDDGTSISQQRGDVADLADRMQTKQWSAETVRDHTTPATRYLFHQRVLPIDMWEYFRAVPGCTDEFWDLLRNGVNELWSPATVRFEHTGLPLRQRVMGWLVSQGMRPELEEFLSWLDAQPSPLPTRQVGGRMVVDHPYAGLPGLPPELVTP